MEYVILTGSWSELVYRETIFLPGFSPNIRTMDVDFLVRNPRRPSPAAQLTSLTKEKGFYVEVDRMTGARKLLDTTGLEVEFLIGKMSAGVEPSLITNVGVTAQALRHMEILSKNMIDAQCLEHTALVPRPEANVIHKMVINRERGTKAEKGARAIKGLLPWLDKEEFDSIFGSLSKREKKSVQAFMYARDLSI